MGAVSTKQIILNAISFKIDTALNSIGSTKRAIELEYNTYTLIQPRTTDTLNACKSEVMQLCFYDYNLVFYFENGKCFSTSLHTEQIQLYVDFCNKKYVVQVVPKPFETKYVKCQWIDFRKNICIQYFYDKNLECLNSLVFSRYNAHLN